MFTLRFLLPVLAAVFGMFFGAAAQKLTVFGGNSDFFPQIQAAFYALDSQNKPINGLSPSNVTVTEGGVPRRVVSITCPPPGAPAKISSVLVMDVSGSMSGGYPVSNMEIAKSAARWWIQALPADGSECAVTSFDNESYLNQDFTDNKTALKNAVDVLQPADGTNYNAGFFLPPGGAFGVAKAGKHKRVVIFLTDGQGLGDETQILAEAAATNAQVFCVGVNLALPDVLKNVAEKSGGAWYESIASPEKIVEVYSIILQKATSLAPCEIIWETGFSCTADRTAVISVPTAQAALNYSVPGINLPRVELSSLSLRFKGIAPGAADTAAITVTAASDSVLVTGITSSNPAFTILDALPPAWLLNRGQSRTFRVRFTPGDSSLTFAQIRLDGNACIGSTLYAMGGFPGKRKPEAMLRVAHPNGGERLITGDTALLTWTGILPVHTVRLDYSTDAGATWLPVAARAGGLSYLWRVPPTPGNRCLLRARQISQPKGADSVLLLKGHTGSVWGVCFSPDGGRVASVSTDKTLRVWDAAAGLLVTSPAPILLPYSAAGNCVAWSPGGRLIGVGGEGKGSAGGAALYDAERLDTVVTIRSATARGAFSCDFTKDGRYFLFSPVFTPDVAVWDVQNSALGVVATSHTQPVKSVRADGHFVHANFPDSISFITASADRSGKILHAGVRRQGTTLTATGKIVRNFSHSDEATSACSHPDGKSNAVVGFLNGALVFSTGAMPYTGDNIRALDWSPDGKLLAIAFNSGKLVVYDIAADRIVRLLDTLRSSALSVRWDPFGSRIVAGFNNGLALIWTIDDVIEQEDVSDNLWEIVSPQFTSKTDVDMGLVRVGFPRDSVVEAIVCVSQNIPAGLRLDSAIILNDADGVFGVISGVPANFASTLPACLPAEVHFQPKRTGLATATLRLFAGGAAFDIALRGTGFDLALAYPGQILDFGKVPVGTSKDTLLKPSAVNVAKPVISINRTSIAGPDLAQFIVTGGDTVIALNISDTAQLNLRFAPKMLGRSSSRVRIDFTGEGMRPALGSPVFIQLFGEGVCALDSSQTIASSFGTATDSAKTGEILWLPLVIRLAVGQSIEAIPQEFGCTLSFNATMLYPLDPLQFGKVNAQGIRTLTVVGQRLPANDTLMLLPMQAMLGNDTAVTVRIDSLWFKGGCPVPVTTGAITIIYTDICAANGAKRLLESSGITALAMLPAPAGESADAVITLAEDTPAALEIHDALGRALLTERQILPAGEHKIRLNLAGIPTGIYSVVLSTRSEVVVARFIKQ